MDINSFSVIMALVLFTIVSTICSLFLYRTKSQHLWIIGFALVLCILRCLIPVEFKGTHNVNVWNIYPEFSLFLEKEVFLGLLVRELLCIVWIVVSLLLLARQLAILIRQIKSNRSIRTLSRDARINQIANKAAEAVHCSVDVDVYVTNTLASPIMTGFFHPVVLIPKSTTEMTDLEIEYIIRHEIAHYKGGDIWYKLAVQILVCILWWNPAVYLLRRTVSQLLELRCDNRACQSLGSKEKADYSGVLLEVIRKTLDTPKKTISSGFVGNFDSLYIQQRIKILMTKSVPKRSPLATVLIACVCLTLYVGSYAFIVQPAAPPPEVEEDDSMVTMTPENAWLVPIEDNYYQVWLNGSYYATVPSDLITLPPFSELPIRNKEDSQK